MNMTVWQVLSMFDAYQKPVVVQSGKGGARFQRRACRPARAVDGRCVKERCNVFFGIA